MCVRVFCFKRKDIATPPGPPATRVRALLGWRPGTDLRVCLKCRLQILCTKSLQEYPWPLESLSGFFSGPAVAARPSLKSSGLAGDEERGRTHRGELHAERKKAGSEPPRGDDGVQYLTCVGGCTCPCLRVFAGAEISTAGVKSSIVKEECSTFSQRGFQHGGESLHMSFTYAKSRTVGLWLSTILTTGF